MYCPYCGNEVNDESKFCNKCGERLDSSINIKKSSEINKDFPKDVI